MGRLDAMADLSVTVSPCPSGIPNVPFDHKFIVWDNNNPQRWQTGTSVVDALGRYMRDWLCSHITYDVGVTPDYEKKKREEIIQLG